MTEKLIENHNLRMSHISNVDSFYLLTEAETAEMGTAEAVEGKTCISEILFSVTHTHPLFPQSNIFFHVLIVAKTKVEVVAGKQLISSVELYRIIIFIYKI